MLHVSNMDVLGGLHRSCYHDFGLFMMIHFPIVLDTYFPDLFLVALRMSVGIIRDLSGGEIRLRQTER